MRALKDAVKDLEEMVRLKEESNKILMATLEPSKHIDKSAKALINSLTNEIAWLKKKYSVLLNRFMKLDLAQNFIKTAQVEVSNLLKDSQDQFNSKLDFQMEENSKLKEALYLLEEKKKITISEGKRRVLVNDTEEAFVILTATNDGLKKEINDKKAEISLLKKEKTDLAEENLQIKAELFKLASMVKIQFFGRSCKSKLKNKEFRDVESQPDVNSDFDESVNWGPIELGMNHEEELKLPNLKISLDGFPGVETRDPEDLLKNARSEPQLMQPIATTMGDQQLSRPEFSRLVRNYRKALYHNQLLVTAFQKNHELLKEYKALYPSISSKKKILQAQVPRNSKLAQSDFYKSRSYSIEPSLRNLRPFEDQRIGKMHMLKDSKSTKAAQSSTVSLAESKKLMKIISQQMRSYFEKLVQRIISPCSFIRINEKDVPELKIKLTRRASW